MTNQEVIDLYGRFAAALRHHYKEPGMAVLTPGRFFDGGAGYPRYQRLTMVYMINGYNIGIGIDLFDGGVYLVRAWNNNPIWPHIDIGIRTRDVTWNVLRKAAEWVSLIVFEENEYGRGQGTSGKLASTESSSTR